MKRRTLFMVVAAVILLASSLLTVRAGAFGFFNNPPYQQNQAQSQNCSLWVPPDPLTATGLSTPYQLIGCDEADPNLSAFVQSTIIAPDGTVGIYSPLVVNQGQAPAAPPVVPTIADGSTVGIWFGFDGIDLHLVGPGARECVNGSFRSDFGQFAYCNAGPLFDAMNAAVTAGTLTVPPVGTSSIGQPCPTVNSFDIVDQDPNDNVQTQYLTGDDAFAQDTAANRALFPSATVLANPSDNALTTNFVDPAIGCVPWTAPDLADPGSMVPSLALDQFQAAAQPASPVAYVPMIDEMTLVNNHEDYYKTLLYRQGVDQPDDYQTATDQYYCTNLEQVFPSWITANQAALSAQPSPLPVATNLYLFMAQRFVATYEMVLPEPGVVPTCDMVTGVPDPVSVLTEAVSATVTIP